MQLFFAGGGITEIRKTKEMIQAGKITLLLSAEAAVPRLSGSTESRVSMSAKAERGTSLNVSVIRRLYGFCGLKVVA